MPLVNETRRSPSIARRLFREGKIHLLPLYALLRTSELGREGMERSGSFRFADHIYAGEPRGRWGFGFLVDALILALPSSRSFRNRYRNARDRVIEEALRIGAEARVLSVPGGIPRELAESARAAPARYFGLDIDPQAIATARTFTSDVEMIEGDAFDVSAYPRDLDVVTSTGLAEFLTDDEVSRFYSICHAALKPGGVLITAATVRHSLSAYLLEEMLELRAHYRDEGDVRRIFARTPFREAEMKRDSVGYQVLIIARA